VLPAGYARRAFNGKETMFVWYRELYWDLVMLTAGIGAMFVYLAMEVF
jgi:hypothetical protein